MRISCCCLFDMKAFTLTIFLLETLEIDRTVQAAQLLLQLRRYVCFVSFFFFSFFLLLFAVKSVN